MSMYALRDRIQVPDLAETTIVGARESGGQTRVMVDLCDPLHPIRDEPRRLGQNSTGTVPAAKNVESSQSTISAKGALTGREPIAINHVWVQG